MKTSEPIQNRRVLTRSRTENSMLNIIVGIGGYVVNTLLGVVCRVVFVRFLPKEYLGINGFFTNILSLLTVAELGIGIAIVYALYKPIAENDTEKIASLMRFFGRAYRIIGIVTAALGVAVMPFIPRLVDKPAEITESIYLLYGVYLFNNVIAYFFSYRGSFLLAAQQNYIVTGVNYIITILQSIFQMIFLAVTKDYMSYLAIQTVGTVVYNIIIYYIAYKKYPYIADKQAKPLDGETKTSLFRNTRDLLLTRVSGLIVNNTDNIIITYFNGLAVTGVTSNYTLFISTLTTLFAQVFDGMTASIGNHNALEDDAKRYEMFRCVNLSNFWLFSWGTVGIAFVSSDLVQVFFRDAYVLHWSIPLILAVNFYLVGMQSAVWAYMQTLGIFHYGRFISFVTAGIKIALSILWGDWSGTWSVFGIHLATAVGRVFTDVWYSPWALYKHGFHIKPSKYLGRYLLFLTVLLAEGGICFGICRMIDFSPLVNLLLKFLVCSIVPNGIFLAVFSRSRDFGMFKKAAGNMLHIVKRKLGLEKTEAEACAK
ncbi:MAG: oligosaccharide flippase family protein [Clostridia bacterium]|nr:oligosaccharide flippase family protein [Clostridia bacterium]